MTRINVIPVTELCDQHLLAEHRELTRIPNGIISGRLQASYPDAPAKYVLGDGHVKFFVNNMNWLYWRYQELLRECAYRKFNVANIAPSTSEIPGTNWGQNYEKHLGTPAAIALNRARINQRLQTMATRGKLQSQYLPCWTRRNAPDWITCSLWAHKPI